MWQRITAALSLLLLLSLSGCVISPRRDGTTTPGGTGTGQLYVVSQSTNSILRFSRATAVSGSTAAAANINGASTQLNTPQYIFLDAANNRLYVANAGGSDILVFDNVSTLNGNVAPTRTITSSNLSVPVDVAVDTTKDLMYVADNLEVAVFATASMANGRVSALRVIQPGFQPGAILIDPTNNRLFIADQTNNAIDVYDGASALNGAVTANRSFTGANTLLSQPDGLRIDGAGRLIVSNLTGPSITIYTNAATNTGNVSPVAVITGGNTALAGPTQLALDPTTNSGELYVDNPSGGNVAVFSSITTVTGTLNPTPNRNLTGLNASTTGGVALDTTR